MLRVAVPGSTANLGPGFDCLGMALGLFNTLEVHEAAHFHMEVAGEGAELIPRGEENLVVQAMDRVFQQAGRSRPPLRLYLENAIPLTRGLGSSAAATVAGLLAANWLCDQVFTRDELLQLAVEFEGHPDNAAPALFGGLVVSWRKKEGIPGYLLLGVPAELKAVVCIPETEVSTRTARQGLPTVVPLEKAVFNLSRLALLLGSFWQQRWDLLDEASQDLLHQPYRMSLVPGMAPAMEAARDHGAWAAMVSGSGPTVMALVSEQKARMVGEAMTQAFASVQIPATWMQLTLEGEGARVFTP